MPKFCRECGSPLEAGVRFCPNCGTQIIGAATQQQGYQQQQSYQQQPQTQQPRPQQPYQQPYQQPRPQQHQHVFDDAYADEKAEGIDWKQFKPRITIGKPEVTFISKRKLIIIAIIAGIVLLLALLQG